LTCFVLSKVSLQERQESARANKQAMMPLLSEVQHLFVSSTFTLHIAKFNQKHITPPLQPTLSNNHSSSNLSDGITIEDGGIAGECSAASVGLDRWQFHRDFGCQSNVLSLGDCLIGSLQLQLDTIDVVLNSNR
jgi:hypothetical protein